MDQVGGEGAPNSHIGGPVLGNIVEDTRIGWILRPAARLWSTQPKEDDQARDRPFIKEPAAS